MSSVNASVFGQSVTFTATVSGVPSGTGTPTGTVTFNDGGTALATETLSGGSATFATSSLAVAEHDITVDYSGDSNFNASSSGTLSQTVNQAMSSTTVTADNNPSVFGQTVTFTATVSAMSPGTGTPTGTVTFNDGGTALATETLSGGSATFATSSLAVAEHDITVDYSGDTNFSSSSSGTLSQTVNQAMSTTTVTADNNPSVFGQTVTFTATVSAVSPGAGTPTGTVTFNDGGTALATEMLSSGSATFMTSALAVGEHDITVDYSGDSNFMASSSGTLSQTVGVASSTTSVVSDNNPSVFGQTVTFTATVSAVSPATGTPTGTVTFNDGGTALATEMLSSGSATFATSSLTVGEHDITVDYSGDANFTASSSGTLSQTVTAASSTTSVTSDKNPSTFGQTVTFTATVSAVSPGTGTPTGTVTFNDAGTPLATETLSSGSATFATSTLTVGEHDITVDYSGDTNFTSSSSATLSQTVNAASTTTTVVTDVNPTVFGQLVTFTATVSAVAPATGTPTGTVTFNDMGTAIATQTLSSGSATFATSTLAVGEHDITVDYSGDSNFAPGSSATLSQTVTQASSTTSVVSDNNPSVFGQTVTFTATVSAVSPGAGTPTGTVTFNDAGTPLATETLSGGSATFATSSLSVGEHDITVDYSGDANFTSGTSGTLSQTVTAASTTTMVAVDINPSTFGQTVTFTATVSAVPPGAGMPTGTVTFDDAGVPIGTGTLSSGSATFATATLSVSEHDITAVYSGDTNFSTSTSDTLSQTVNPSATTTTLAVDVNPSVFGQPVTFTATVSAVAPGAGIPTGTVTFEDGGTPIGTAALGGGGSGFIMTGTLAVGEHDITAVYGGDTNFTSSTSSTLSQTVTTASTTTTVAVDVNPSVFGQPVTFTATVSAVSPSTGTPTGTVTFEDAGVSIGTATLSSGSATFATSTLAVGEHDITAVYAGDTNFTGSTSATLSQTVTTASTTTTVAADVNPSVFGQTVTFTATVSAVAPSIGTPTGTVTFDDNGVTIGTATLSGGSATLATSTLTIGTHPITVSYSGDTNFTGSTSDTLSQTVNQAASTTTVVSSANPSVFGQTVTFTATVGAAAPGTGTPTGTVTFEDAGVSIGTGTVSGGSASFAAAALSVGTHTITAVFSGDSNFTTSTSDTLSQTVNQASTTTGIASSLNPSIFGQSVTFTATVGVTTPGAGTPTGTVTFEDAGTSIGTATLSSGSASFSTTTLAVGTHPITAVYSGDTNFATSTSATLSQTVSQASTTTGITSSLNPSIFGQSVTFTATVGVTTPGAGTPTGTVTFEDAGTSIGTATLSGGSASFSTTTLAVGTHPITAVYSGDTNFATSTSSTLSQTVSQATSSTTVTSSVNPSVFGQSVTFTATVSATSPGGGTPTGTVTFEDNGTSIGTATLSGGSASFSTSTLSVGTHPITAVFSGDTNFATSTSSAVSQTVSTASTTTTVVSSLNPSVSGQSVTFTATVSATSPGAGTPTGTVTFLDGTTTLSTMALSDGSASFSTSTLAVGSHSITASYSGDTNFAASTSSALTQTVTQTTPAVSFIATGTDVGIPAQVKVFNGATGAQVASFLAFDPHFLGGVHVAVGDFNGDGTPDIVCAAGISGTAEIKIIDGTKLSQVDSNGEILQSALIADFNAFPTSFNGGAYVAVGNFTGGSGGLQVAASEGPGGNLVSVFSISGGVGTPISGPLGSFMPYAQGWLGGASIAAASVDGLPGDDIITGALAGGGPHVKVFDQGGIIIGSFYAYAPSFIGGVYVSAADFNGDGKADIVTGPGISGGPQVKIVDGTKLMTINSDGTIPDSSLLASYMAYDPAFLGGVRVGAAQVLGSTHPDVITGPGFSGGPQLKVFDGLTTNVLDTFFAYDANQLNGIFVGGG
jgi:FKBP-type peptidyl-prolyl cis-trans isomerase 2